MSPQPQIIYTVLMIYIVAKKQAIVIRIMRSLMYFWVLQFNNHSTMYFLFPHIEEFMKNVVIFAKKGLFYSELPLAGATTPPATRHARHDARDARHARNARNANNAKHARNPDTRLPDVIPESRSARPTVTASAT